MDESLLPPPARSGARPVPWRAIAALSVPAAALAAGTGLQRWLEGSAPSGDALLRWLLWSAGAGLYAACARRDRRLLGEPQQALCKDGACTLRWLYRGPFRPEQRAPRGAFLCSVVTDARGNGIRSSLMAVADP